MVIEADEALGIKVLRRVSGMSAGTYEEVAKSEGDEPYFPDYVDNDLPRDAAYSDEIMSNTLGFGVADANGTILKKFKKLEDAEAARSNARVTFNVNIEGMEDDTDGTDNQ